MRAILVNPQIMSAARIEQAMTRIVAAMERIESARDALGSIPPPSPPETDDAKPSDSGNAAKLMSLINAHEQLREEVAETIGEIDTLIESLET